MDFVYYRVIDQTNLFIGLTTAEENTLLSRKVLLLQREARSSWVPENSGVELEEPPMIDIRWVNDSTNYPTDKVRIRVIRGLLGDFHSRLFTQRLVSLKELAAIKEMRLCESN